jgi:hypothetical protein
MFQFDFVLALALLSGPPDAVDAAGAPESYDSLRPVLQTLAVQLEILDPREVRYILARPEDFQSDLNLLRRRYRDLVDAPPVNDSMRFPDRESINEMLSFNRAYRQYIDTRQTVELSHWWEHQATLQETEQLYQIWDTVRDARCEYYYVTVRRQALKRLREQLGPENYYAGQLPPYVPVWRFQVIR